MGVIRSVRDAGSKRHIVTSVLLGAYAALGGFIATVILGYGWGRRVVFMLVMFLATTLAHLRASRRSK